MPDKRKTRNQKGKNNPNWKGDKIKSYSALHQWIKRYKPIPNICEICKNKKDIYGSYKLVLANISGKYKRNLDDWIYCHQSCHIQEHKKGNHKNIKFKNLYKQTKISVHYLEQRKKYKKKSENIIKNRIYRKKNIEKRRLYNNIWRENNREKSRKYQSEYYQKNKNKLNLKKRNNL